MGQGQKPFEVMTGVVVLGQEYSFKIFAEGKADLFAVSTAAKIIAKYAINANAEIRRLQNVASAKESALTKAESALVEAWNDLNSTQKCFDKQVKETKCLDERNRTLQQHLATANAEIQRHESVVKQLMSNIDFHVETISSLKSEIDNKDNDAPTWGEWVECTTIPKTIEDSFYEVEFLDNHTELWTMGRLNSYFSDFIVSTMKIPNKITRFRRLNYEPKPAQNQGAAEMTNEIPRRNRIDLYTSAEKAIRAAILEVEEMGAHPILTEAVGLLGNAQNKVADFVELDPAREAEKTYKDFVDGENLTAKEVADEFPNIAIGELARDLLVAQARIRELEGKR